MDGKDIIYITIIFALLAYLYVKKIENRIKKKVAIPLINNSVASTNDLVQIKIAQLGFYGLIFVAFFVSLTSNVYNNDEHLRLIFLLIVLAGIIKLYFEFIFRDRHIEELFFVAVASLLIFSLSILINEDGTRFFLSFIIGYSAVGFVMRYFELTWHYQELEKNKTKN